jgi:hypothetical protein
VYRRRVALIGEAFRQHARETADRLVFVRVVIAFRFAGQQHVQGVVRVVVPLRVEMRFQQARAVVLVFQHQMHVPAVLHFGADMIGQFAQPRVVVDSVHRVETQPVETIFVDPVDGVIREEVAHFAALEIDRRAPRRVPKWL